MSMCRAFGLAVVLLAAAPAGAMPEPPGDSADAIAVRGDSVVLRPKRPGTALIRSGLGTAAMLIPGLNLVAIPAGPALGHFYAGNTEQAWIGIGIRGGALYGGTLLIALSALEGGPGGDEQIERYLTGIVAVVLASAAYDVATAPAAARRYNRAHGIRVALVPVVGDQRGVRLAVRL